MQVLEGSGDPQGCQKACRVPASPRQLEGAGGAYGHLGRCSPSSKPACVSFLGLILLRLGLHNQVNASQLDPCFTTKTHPSKATSHSQSLSLCGGAPQINGSTDSQVPPWSYFFLPTHGVFSRLSLPQGQADRTWNHKLAEEKESQTCELSAPVHGFAFPAPAEGYLWSGA